MAFASACTSSGAVSSTASGSSGSICQSIPCNSMRPSAVQTAPPAAQSVVTGNTTVTPPFDQGRIRNP